VARPINYEPGLQVKLEFSSDSLKRLFGFSGWLFGANFLDTIYQRGYTLLIGEFFGTYDLGIYNRAESTQMMTTGVLTGVLSRVAFPLFSSVNSDKERLRRGIRLSVKSITLIIAPCNGGIGCARSAFHRRCIRRAVATGGTNSAGLVYSWCISTIARHKLDRTK
jgi:O-antigen/teichoic acid export membrane protein